jgi:hypothetical protein
MTVENPPAAQGSVVLDIGGDVGSLVVTCRRSWRVSRWRSIASTLQPKASLRATIMIIFILMIITMFMITTRNMIMSIHMIIRRTVDMWQSAAAAASANTRVER